MQTNSIAELKPDLQNARKHSKKNLDMIAKSLAEVGAARSIVIDEDNNILAGNGTVEAAGNIGLHKLRIVDTAGDELIAVRRSGLTSEQKQKLAIFDNRTAELAQWDTGTLRELNQEMDLSFAFSSADLQSLGIGDEIKEDEIPEPPVEARTKPGDLYQLGRHRLLCGDATDSDDLQKLMDGRSGVLMVTDPPYGVSYNPEWRKTLDGRPRSLGKVSNDDNEDWGTVYALWQPQVLYVWHASTHAKVVQSSIEDAGYDIVSQIIWAKPSLVISRGHYHYQHDPCWYAVRHGMNQNWHGDRKQSTLWQIRGQVTSGRSSDSNDETTGHSTQKPLECMSRPIHNNSSEGDIVVDPFLGSGTTIIAAEQLNRICYGMEIEPRYCDMIVSRYCKLVGSDSVIRDGAKIDWGVP